MTKVRAAMEHLETRCLIVQKNRHADDEYDMLLTTNIAHKALPKHRSKDRGNVDAIMAKPVITLSPKMDTRCCARLFERFDLTRAPVCEHHQEIGIASLADGGLRGLVSDD